MFTATLAAAHPMPAHQSRRAVVKVAAGIVLLAAASAGMWEGAQAVTRHYQQPTSNVSYATQATIDRTVQQAWHTPAKLGAFRTDANISGGNVVSVVVAVP